MHILRKLLFPFSLVYGLVVALRNFLFDVGIFSSKSYDFPVICIGNLSVGGTGKTPMTEYLLRLLKDRYKTAVLSRGYKRKSKGFILADAQTKVSEIGDEPFQYKRKFNNIHVAVDANRQNGISELDKLIAPDVILLDDGFQHRKVKAGFNILLTVYDDLYVNDLMLPAGNLRDQKKQAKRAQFIIVTKCPEDLSESERDRIIKKLNPGNHQDVFFSTIVYSETLKNTDTQIPLTDLKKKPFTLVTGIANPKSLLIYLRDMGLNFKHLNFPDHHHFNESEIKKLSSENMVITTEKDFVRLKDQLQNVCYLEIKTKFLFEDEKKFNAKISNFIKENIKH